jgi:hypothetical protein
MKKIAVMALSALLLTALAVPAMAQTLNPTSACTNPQVTVQCVRSPSQNTGQGSYNMGTEKTGQVLVTCTLQLETQALNVAWFRQPQISSDGNAINFHAVCGQNKLAE